MIAKPDNRTMSTRVASRLAWAIWILTCCVALLTFLFIFLNWFTSFPVLFCCAGVSAVLIVSFSVTSITVGALIASRRARNPIGWIFGSASLLISLWLFAFHYAIYTGLTYPNSLPGGAMMAWMGQWLWLPGWGLIALMFLLFPNGHLPSRRWWPVAAFLTGSWVITMICLAFLPGQLEWSVWVYKNPFGVGGVLGTALGRLLSVSYLLSYLSFLASAISLVYRFYKAVGIERQQIKWIAYAGAVFGLAFLFSVIFYGAEYWSEPGVRVLFLAVNGFPLAVGIAILRYRLYNIDLLFNRTLVYGALTASVVGLYVLSVGGFGILFQTQNNLPGIVIAILLVAVCFQPLRQRLQNVANRLVPVPQSTSPSEQTEDKITVSEGAMLRHNRVALVTLAIAFLLLTLGATFVVMRLITPYDDARLQPGVKNIWHSNGIVISPLDQQTNGLQKGDLVVAVNGRSLESFAQSLFDWSAPRPQWNRGQTLMYTVVRDGRTLDVAVIPTSYPLSAIFAEEWGAIVFAISILLITGFIFFKRPDESSARVLFLGAAGMASSIIWVFGLQISDIVGAVGWWLYIAGTAVGYPLMFMTMLHLSLVFPQPHPIILRWRWLIPLIYLVPYSILLATMIIRRVTAVSTLQWLATIGSAAGPIQLVCVILAIIIHARNYGSLRDPISRRQLRWVLFAVSVAGITGIVFGVIPELVMGHALLSWSVLALFGLLVPLALGFAILRYRLFDIDVIINRAVVYLTLTAIVVGIYVLVVGYLGALFHARNDLAISLIATGLVAVVFQPLRQRLQRGINRMMYGERDDPYVVLSRLGQRLEAAYAPESVLPTIVETVAQTLKLPYVGIALNQDGDFKIAAEFGRSKNESISLPLNYHGEPVGELILAPRAPGEQFTSSERQLLDDLARQAGVAAHAVRLTTDLQRSRERLVAAREEERRRLRRDLHDGLGPQLASLALKLETARNRMASDPDTVSLLTDLSMRTQEAVADIRRLVYALRPPALDELGLVMALREGATQYNQQGTKGVNITFDAPESLPPLPAAVEVAVYRIAQEALTNVLRHAEARNCFVRLRLDESRGLLCLEVQDDGKGLPIKRRAGVGLNSMRERAEELGGTLTITPIPTGGTSLIARLPCRPIKPAPPGDQHALAASDEEV